MNSGQLKKFKQALVSGKKHGYAAGDKAIIREKDGSYSTRRKDGDFEFHDNWFGGEPFGGREVVFYKNKPYWMMVYYGSDSGKAPGVIEFLRKALRAIPEDIPLRGPRLLKEGKFRYENKCKGKLERFIGEEVIFYNGQEVFKTNYVGGLVDQRGDQ